MAKVVLGPMVGQASGKIGGIVFSRGRGGTYVRRRAHPTVNTSSYAENAKSTFATVSSAWAGLSTLAREAWTVWASNNPIVDRVGNKITLDGHAGYVKVNSFREAVGGGLMALPPVVGPPAGLQSLTLDGAIVSSALNVHFTPSQATTSMTLTILACVKESSARQYVKGSLRFCGNTPAAQVSQFNVMTLVQNRLGTIQNGDVVHVQVGTYDPVSGLRSLPLSASAEITGIVP